MLQQIIAIFVFESFLHNVCAVTEQESYNVDVDLFLLFGHFEFETAKVVKEGVAVLLVDDPVDIGTVSDKQFTDSHADSFVLEATRVLDESKDRNCQWHMSQRVRLIRFCLPQQKQSHHFVVSPHAGCYQWSLPVIGGLQVDVHILICQEQPTYFLQSKVGAVDQRRDCLIDFLQFCEVVGNIEIVLVYICVAEGLNGLCLQFFHESLALDREGSTLSSSLEVVLCMASSTLAFLQASLRILDQYLIMSSDQGLNFISDITSNPITQIGVNQLKERLNFGSYGASRIFTPEIRAYFDVDTATVKNKLLKLLFPFKAYQFDDQIKKLELYLPIVSLMTLILFSTLLEGIQSTDFHPNIARRTIWIMIFTLAEVLLAKCTENAVSNLNISIIELSSLVSYRFVSISAVVILLVLTNASIPYMSLLGGIYALLVDTYYCKLELSNFAKDHMKDEGLLGNKIALLFHLFTTIAILWLCNIL